MNILTPYGYKDIADVNIGDEVVAFDTATGTPIINVLKEKRLIHEEVALPSRYKINDQIYRVNDVFWRGSESVYAYQINEGDEISFNFHQQTFLVESTEELPTDNYKELGDFIYYRINDKWNIFKAQSIWVNNNIVHGYEVKIDDIIYDENDQQVNVFSVEKITDIKTWWKLRIGDDEILADHSFISEGIILHNASRFLVAGGTGNWNSTTNWAASSGAGSGASFPVAGDDVNIDAGSGTANITVNVASACSTITVINAYTGTWTETNTITTTGNVTWGSGMTITGAGNWIWNGSATITSNGKTFSGGLTISGAGMTITLSGDCTINGAVDHTTTGTTCTINNNNFKLLGNYTASSGRLLAGSATLLVAGTTGTSTLNCSGTVSNPVVFNSTNAISIAAWGQAGGSITYTAASSITSTGLLSITGSLTLNVSAINWNSVLFNASTTYTLSGILNVTGTLTLNTSPTFSGAFDINCGSLTVGSSGGIVTMSGNINSSGTISSGAATITTFNGAFNVNASGSVTIGTNWSGTATLNYTGTGTFGGATSASILQMNTIINTTGATFSSFNFRNNTLTWTAIGTSTFGTTVLFLGGVAGTHTMTVNCTGLVIPTLKCNGSTNTIINGSQGFTITNYLSNAGIASKVTWQTGNTYTINSSIIVNTTLALTHVWVSSSPGTRYTIILSTSATQDIRFMTVTDADGSAGQTFWPFAPVSLSNTLNWNSLTASAMQFSAPYVN